MGGKTSKPKQNEFAIYLLANDKEETLKQAQREVTAYGSNAILLFPDPSDESASSNGARKYVTHYIVDGHWQQKKMNLERL